MGIEWALDMCKTKWPLNKVSRIEKVIKCLSMTKQCVVYVLCHILELCALGLVGGGNKKYGSNIVAYFFHFQCRKPFDNKIKMWTTFECIHISTKSRVSNLCFIAYSDIWWKRKFPIYLRAPCTQIEYSARSNRDGESKTSTDKTNTNHSSNMHI